MSLVNPDSVAASQVLVSGNHFLRFRTRDREWPGLCDHAVAVRSYEKSLL